MEPLPFDPAVYEARVGRVRERMRLEGLDALLLYSQESLYYLFGYDQIGYWVYQAVVLPAEGSPIAICRKADLDLIAAAPGLDDARAWSDTEADAPARMTKEALRDAGVAEGRVGAEWGTHALQPLFAQQVAAGLSAHEVVDATGLVTGIRQRKSAEEVAYVRRAAQIMDAAFERARAELTAGVRECDLHAVIAETMYRMGADPPAIPPPIGSGPRTLTQTHGAATERVIGPGDLVTIEIGASYRRYHSVGVRTLSVGEPRGDVARTHEGLLDGLAAGFAGLRPGMPASQLAAKVQSSFAGSGLSRAGRHVGYGIGIGYPPSWLEALRIKETDDTPLDAGMTFFYFAGTHAGEGDYVITGDPVLMGPDGPARLSGLPRELFVVS